MNTYISLGTNLGNRQKNLKTAILEIASKLGKVVKQSSVYETKPWGKHNQPDFLNQVILVHSDKTPQDGLYILSAIEKNMGRRRIKKWDARIIDLDLLYVNDLVINSETLTLPHPEIPRRRFVLVPLTEIDPDFIHPQLQKSQKQLLNECTDPLDVVPLET